MPSIVHRPSSIVHRPSSIVHRPSSIVLASLLILFSGCQSEFDEPESLEQIDKSLTFGKGSNFNREQVSAWADSETDLIKSGNLFLKSNLSRTTAHFNVKHNYDYPIGSTPAKTVGSTGSGTLISSDMILTAAHVAEPLDYIMNYPSYLSISGHVHNKNFLKMKAHNVKLFPFDKDVRGGTFVEFNQRRIVFENNVETKMTQDSMDWFALTKWKQLGLEPVTLNTNQASIPLINQLVMDWPIMKASDISFKHWSSEKRDLSVVKFSEPKLFDDGGLGVKSFRFYPGVFFSSILPYMAPQKAGGETEEKPRLRRPSVGDFAFVLSHNFRNTKLNPPSAFVDHLMIDTMKERRENLIHMYAKNLSGIINNPNAVATTSFVPEERSNAGYETNINYPYQYMVKTNIDLLEGSSGGGYFTYKEAIGKYWNFFELQGVVSACDGASKCDSITGTAFTDPSVDEEGLDKDGSKYASYMTALSDSIVTQIYETVGNNGLPYLGVPAYDECAKKAASDAERALCDAQLNCSAADAENPNKCLFRSGLGKIQRGSTVISSTGPAGALTATTNFEEETSEASLQEYANKNNLRTLECFGRPYAGLGANRLANLNVGIVGGISKDEKGVGTLGVICSPRSYTEWTMNWDFLYAVMLHKVDGNLRGKADLENHIFKLSTNNAWDGFYRLLFADFYNNHWSKIPKDPEVPVASNKDKIFATPATQFCPPGFIMRGISYDYALGSEGKYVAAISKIHCIDMMRGQPHSEDMCVGSVGRRYPCTISLWADKSQNPIPSTHPHYGRTLSQPIGMRFNNTEIALEANLVCEAGYHLTGIMVPNLSSGKVESVQAICRPY
jgi:hypothetical protein